jgi:hypothetical protein
MTKTSVVPLALMALCTAMTMTIVRARQSPTPVEPRPTTYALIDRALEAKRLDEETAHKYRVFAAFGDERLPREYRGAVERGDRASEIDRAGARLETFSSATRAELAPYFMRPDQPGSWVELTGADEPAPVVGGRRGGLFLASYAFARQPRPPAPVTWRKFPAVGGKVMVWAQDRYAGDAAKAEAIARAMDADRIWTRLTGLMGREPVSDVLINPNGGDGALDIYLVHPALERDPDTGQRSTPWFGVARSARPANICHPIRYLLIDSRNPLVGNRKTPGLLSIAAHELFHAITYAYQVVEGCDLRWMREGTATWAENWIYPAPDSEHEEAREYLRLIAKPIDDLKDMHPDYGTYLFSLYLEKTTGGPGFMRTMWDNFVKMNAPPLPDSATYAERVSRVRSNIDRLNTLKAISPLLDGGWDKTWPQFLLKVWNQAPTDAPQGYRSWDRLTEAAAPWPTKQSIATPGEPVMRQVAMPATLEGYASSVIMPLAGVFTHFTFEPNVRSVVFVNTIAEIAHPHKSVWGIQKIRGNWEDPEDWTTDFQKAWCRSESEEDIEELVIVFGNSDSLRLEPVKPEKLPEIKAYPYGCTAWTGTVEAEKTIVTRDPALKIVERVSATVRLEVDPELNLPGQPREYWKLTGGQLAWNVTATGLCTGSASGQLALTDRGPGEEIATLNVWEEEKRLRYSGGTGPWPGDIPTYTLTCPKSNEPPPQMVLFLALGWWTTDMRNNTVEDNGMTIRGKLTTNPADGVTDRFSFELRRSP